MCINLNYFILFYFMTNYRITMKNIYIIHYIISQKSIDKMGKASANDIALNESRRYLTISCRPLSIRSYQEFHWKANRLRTRGHYLSHIEKIHCI